MTSRPIFSPVIQNLRMQPGPSMSASTVGPGPLKLKCRLMRRETGRAGRSRFHSNASNRLGAGGPAVATGTAAYESNAVNSPAMVQGR